MQKDQLQQWQHDHTFGQNEIRDGERKTIIVIAITAIMMVVEITTGVIFGSIALLADGIHMGSHATALIITAAAYIYARKQAGNSNYNFGTGKVNALAGFSSAIILAAFALTMVVESIERFINPVEIAFNQSILVAIIGLVVNVVSAVILNTEESGHHHHHREEDHDHDDEHDHQHHDHNLRAAYLHVLADALTSLLAIAALLGGKYFNLIWMDPLMGFVGAYLVTRWSLGLLRETSSILLDHQGPKRIRREIRENIEASGKDWTTDLHLWLIGPGRYACIVSVVSDAPKPPEVYKEIISHGKPELVHVTVEINKNNLTR